MQCDFHRRERFRATAIVRFFCAVSLSAILLSATSASTLAQNSPTQPIGRIEGADVTVDSGMPASVATADSPASIYVSNGSTVTVHSGKARLALDGGGVLDICGPAKFTMLTSGSEITVALNFGRLHVQLPAHTSLKIFSPTIIATPIDINGGSRDVTIGLDVNDSLCVLATSGAIQLEQQFTNDKIIVPQAGQFFLNGGQLVPVAGNPGSCGCTPMDERANPSAPAKLPVFAQSAPPQPVSLPETPNAESEPSVESPAPQATVEPGAVLVIPVHPDNEQPLAQPERESVGAPPELGESLHGDVTPALAFMASQPPPSEAQTEMMLLVSEARESPDWEFNGHVDAPEFAQAMRHALGEEPGAAKAPSARQPSGPAKKKHGFWASLKGLFVGNVEAAGPSN